MYTLPREIIQVISTFAPVFSTGVWSHAQGLLIGAILSPGKRTISAILRVMGLSQARNYTTYYRVMNRAVWSALLGSRILLGLLVMLVPSSLPLVLGIDETLERRRGKQIHKKGTYRDPVASTRHRVVCCLGLKWLSMMLLVSVPWSTRVWALPFLTVLVSPEPKGATKSHKSRHKSYVDWTRQMIKQVMRWQPLRQLVIVGDGAYCAIELVRACQAFSVTLISRLHWNAALYHEPEKQSPGKRGPKPKKGKRQRTLTTWAKRKDTPFILQTLTWYGGKTQKRLLFSRKALWHRMGYDPVSIRYVIVRDPKGKEKDDLIISTNPNLDPVQIVEYFVMRWSVEVTFQEARTHLGFETLRNWKDKAVERTSPCLLALFSIVTLMAHRLRAKQDIPLQQSAWYKKQEPTFSDVLFMVRLAIWRKQLEKVPEKHTSAYFSDRMKTLCELYDYPLVA